jgi:drug/metabolite transporter (DMT)-like permease
VHYSGELIALAVAVMWTVTAMCFEFAGNRIGSLVVNLLRLGTAFVLLGLMLWVTTGSMWPAHGDGATWGWMCASGVVGFVFGDLCLFYSYTIITARFSQLLMTLAPPFAALFGWTMLGERLSVMALVGMLVTLTGIAISVMKRETADESDGRSSNAPLKLHLPLRGVLFGLGGALGQGLGIVLSKKGMIYYEAAAQGSAVADYIPFAATQMRIITGVIGFALIILFSGRLGAVRTALRDGRAMGAVFAGSIFGPFLGVSLSLMAVQYASTAVASTIMATTPILILVPYLLFRRHYNKRVTRAEIIGAVLSVVGVSLFFL